LGGSLSSSERLEPSQTNDFGWFGHDSAAFEVRGRLYVAVGEPNYRTCEDDCDSVGRVVVLDDGGAVVAEMVGEQALGRFGYSVEAGLALVNGEEKTGLVVGAPGEDARGLLDGRRAGVVRVYDTSDLAATLLTTLGGACRRCGFGMRLALLPEGYLLVGSPRWHDGGGERERGAVAFYRDMKSKPDLIAGPNEVSNFGGSALTAAATDGGAFAVGATSDSAGARQGGALYIYTY